MDSSAWIIIGVIIFVIAIAIGIVDNYIPRYRADDPQFPETDQPNKDKS